MKKHLLFIMSIWFAGTISFGQELIQNGDFELPDDGVKYSRIDSIPGWLTDDVTADCNGREIIETNGVAWHWDGAGGIYQVIGTVPSTAAQYDFTFDATCFYSYWSGDYITDVYVIFSAFSGDDASTRVPIDTTTFTVSCIGSDYMEWVTKTDVFDLAEGNPHAGENLVFEIEIYDSRLFGYDESWSYLYYDNVSVYKTPVTIVKDLKNNGLSIVSSPEMIRISYEKAIESAVIFDISGKRVMEVKPNSTNVNLNVGHLDHGIYIISILTNGERLTRKVVL
jgi:hypothetical protein